MQVLTTPLSPVRSFESSKTYKYKCSEGSMGSETWNYDRPTDQPINRLQTNMRWGVIRTFHTKSHKTQPSYYLYTYMYRRGKNLYRLLCSSDLKLYHWPLLGELLTTLLNKISYTQPSEYFVHTYFVLFLRRLHPGHDVWRHSVGGNNWTFELQRLNQIWIPREF